MISIPFMVFLPLMALIYVNLFLTIMVNSLTKHKKRLKEISIKNYNTVIKQREEIEMQKKEINLRDQLIRKLNNDLTDLKATKHEQQKENN